MISATLIVASFVWSLVGLLLMLAGLFHDKHYNTPMVGPSAHPLAAWAWRALYVAIACLVLSVFIRLGEYFAR